LSKQYHIRWRKCQKYFYVTHWQKKFLTYLTLYLYTFSLLFVSRFTSILIILIQLRCNASFLNYDLCKVKILSNASCNSGAPWENSHHFFFDCDKYTDNREILYNSLNWLPSNINIDVNLLTKRSQNFNFT
jgi:hypothetical protein